MKRFLWLPLTIFLLCSLVGGGGGNFLHKKAEYNLQQGIEFAKTFFRLWPSKVDVIFSPEEVGSQIDYEIKQVIADINWTDIHPIKQIYMNFNCDTGSYRYQLPGDDAWNTAMLNKIRNSN